MALLNKLLGHKYRHKAKEWQRRALQIHKETGGDCDFVTSEVLQEMQKEGLELGKDMVIMRSMYDENAQKKYGILNPTGQKMTRHIAIDMNGFRIDGVSPNLPMEGNHFFKGKYIK